jgi:hypothetical protein
MKDIIPQDAMQWKSDKTSQKCFEVLMAVRAGTSRPPPPEIAAIKKCKTLA